MAAKARVLTTAQDHLSDPGRVFDEELARCNDALDQLRSGAPGLALALFPGKAALRAVVLEANCRTEALYWSRARDLDPEAFPALAALKHRILNALGM